MKKLLLFFLLLYTSIYSMNSGSQLLTPDEIDWACFDFEAPGKDNASNDFLITAQKLIKAQPDTKIRTVLISHYDSMFEKICDKFDIFQIQRLSFISLLCIDGWTIRGYVAQHCFEQSSLPKEQREARMKVVLQYPHLQPCKKYKELGLCVGKDNNHLTILHPAIHSTIIK